MEGCMQRNRILRIKDFRLQRDSNLKTTLASQHLTQ